VSVATSLSRQSWTRLQAKLADAWRRIGHWDVFSNPEDFDLGRLARPNACFWVGVFLWEMRSFLQRMRFARERFSTPKCTGMGLLCQTCSAAGNRFCYKNVDRYMLHIEELESLCPWIGWADRVLSADTWCAALDKACCTPDSAKTLRHADCGPSHSAAEDAITKGSPEWWRSRQSG
jgi:hypothetical protein